MSEALFYDPGVVKVIRAILTVLRTPSAATLTVFDLEFTAWECSMASQWLRPGEFKEGVQIVGSHVSTKQGHVMDRFQLTELDGSPLTGARQLAVQTAVLGALREG